MPKTSGSHIVTEHGKSTVGPLHQYLEKLEGTEHPSGIPQKVAENAGESTQGRDEVSTYDENPSDQELFNTVDPGREPSWTDAISKSYANYRDNPSALDVPG